MKTQQQHTYIFNDDYEKFIQLISERQEIIEDINRLNEENPHPLDEEEKELLIEIQRIDAENRIEYDRQLEEVKSKLRELNQMERTQNQYSNVYNGGLDHSRTYDYSGGKWNA